MEVNNIDSTPFFSVLVPVYNQEKYLPECIESVLNQTFKDFELILIDDGSTDSSGILCDQYAQEHPRLITVIHQKNQGPLFARRAGIGNAKGAYYLFLDADDSFCSTAMETLYNCIRAHSVQMVIFNASFQDDFETKSNNYPFPSDSVLEGEKKRDFLNAFCGTHMFNSMCLKCVHKSIIDSHDCDNAINEFKAKFGEHVHVLDWALHLDESTPHIHERHVFDCKNKYGEVAPQQEKALEALGFDLPDPDKPLSRRNNRKITFDAACRKMLFEIAKRHGLDLEEEAEYGNRKYLEKQDFILAKQKEQLAVQQNRLDELTLKVNDMETLIDEVSAAAYDKAVEVVTDVVRTETRKEDMRMIEDTKKWVLSPERKAPQATREYAAHRLDIVLDKFLKTVQTTAARLQEKLLKPEARQKGKEQVKEKARDSVLQLLSRLQAEQAQRNPSVLSTAEKSENRFQ